jgi:hypothetical protein
MSRQGSDRRILRKLVKYLDKKKTSRKISGHLMLEIGRFFIGAPYLAGPLETEGREHLVVNLRKFDCVTFVESVVALAWLAETRWSPTGRRVTLIRGPCGATSRPHDQACSILLPGEKSFETFRKSLRKIRYRSGRLQGYPSRLHYFSDWIHDNQRKGILKEVTRKIGGRALRKAINFMTTHAELYPPLKNASNFRSLKSVEERINRRPLSFIPKKDLRRLEDRIRDGNLIAVTSNVEGLDVQHVGLAVRVKHRIHLLHASSSEGKVVLSEETLYRYLMKSRTRSGIMVARIRGA